MSSLDQITAEQDQWIAQAMERDGSRLRNYIRKHVVDLETAEDILQEVFCELVEAYRLLKPIEQVSGGCSGWRRTGSSTAFAAASSSRSARPNMARMTMTPSRWKTCCPRRIADPEAAYARSRAAGRD